MPHSYHPHCGCDSCDSRDLHQERIDEAVERMLDDPQWVEKHVEDAEEWVSGTFDCEHESATTIALWRLHHHSGELSGSSVLEEVIRMAKVRAEAIDAQLRILAQAEAGAE